MLGDIRKQSFYSTIYIYAGFFLGFISTGILMPRFLSESENGVLKLISSYTLLFAQLGSLGFPVATIKFIPQFRNKDKGHNGFFILVLIAGLTGFLVFTIIYYFLKPVLLGHEQSKSSLFADYFFLILPLTFFEIFFNQIDGYARALFKSTLGSFFKEFFQRLLILLVLLLYIFNWVTFKSFVFLYVGALSVSTIILFISLFFQGEISLNPRLLQVDKKMIYEIILLSGFGLLIGFSATAIVQIDSIMINFFYNTELTGIYAITFAYGALVLMPSRALFRIASTYISEAFNKKDYKTIEDIQYKSCLNQYIAGLSLFLLLWVNIDNIFVILPKSFLPGKYVIFFIGIGNLIHMLSGLSSQLIINSPKYKYSAIFVIIFLLILILADLALIPAFGIIGAALGSVISILIFSIIKFLFLRKNFDIQPYNRSYLTITLVGLVSYLIAYIMPSPGHLIINLAIKSGILSILMISGIYFLNLSIDINDLINKGIRKVLRR